MHAVCVCGSVAPMRRCIRFIQCCMLLAFIDCKLELDVQLTTAVYKNFGKELVSGELMCTMTDIRTNVTTCFNALEHFLHVYNAPFNNFAVEDDGCMSNRGGKEYQPVIVTVRYPPSPSDVQIFNLRSSCAAHCARDSLPGDVDGDVVPCEM